MMIARRLITRALSAWRLWRFHRRMHRLDPVLVEIDRGIAQARRAHRATRSLMEAKRHALHARLRDEIAAREEGQHDRRICA